MNLDEYVQRKQGLLARLLRAITWVLLGFLRPGMPKSQQTQLIRALYPLVAQYRVQAAELARDFYDGHRELHRPSLPRHDQYLETHYQRDWFEEAMRPVFERGFTETEHMVVEAENRITKVVEDAARRQLMHAVDTDQEAIGWARYDPRPPTCAFCTMMISRGPEYKSPRTAGLDTDGKTAAELFRRGDYDSLNALMDKWHPGCTCVVVPVYDHWDYETQEQEDAAFDIYQKARDLVQADGKKPTAKNILNAMRRLLRDQEKEETVLPAA